MGMSTYVDLLRDENDPEYQKKLKVLLACKEAGLAPPPEVDEYFGGDGVDSDPDHPLKIEFIPREYEDEDGCSVGFEIDVGDLPEGVKTIRFYNSY